MKKLLLCVVLAVIAAAILGVAGLTGVLSQGTHATASASGPPKDRQCMFVIAGKKATTDGSVIMGYNNDWAANNYAYLQVVPATASTYGFTRLQTLGKIREGGINEHRLAICYGVATSLDPAVKAADPYVSKGTGEFMWDTILQRFTTARQAIDWLEQTARTTGFSAWAAGSLGIADGNEAWVFEFLGGHHFVAARVPDNAYYAQPNMLRIRQVDLSDRANFRGSPDLASFAQSIGRYDPASGPLDVAWAYGDRADLQGYYDTNRLWGVTKRWSPKLAPDPSMPYASRPVFAVPDHLLSRADVMAFNREHYEGTQLDQTDGYTLMTPHQQTDRPICCVNTDYGAVFQLRGALPEGIGGVLWMAPSRPCSSAFVPIYCSVTSLPGQWTTNKAYNAFSVVADSLDKKTTAGAETRYHKYIGLVRTTFGGFNSTTVSQQATVEKSAARLWTTDKAKAIATLTSFSGERATSAFNLALGLPAQMP